MENNISDPNKTDEVHIEEYDKTDSVDSEEYGFDDIESEEPEDVDFEDEIDNDDPTTPGLKVEQNNKRSIGQIIEEKIPSLANLFKRAKEKRAQSDSGKTEEVKSASGAVSDSNAKPKFKLTPIHIVVIVGLVVLLFFGDEEVDTVSEPAKPIQKVRSKPAERVAEPEIASEPDIISDVEESPVNDIEDDEPIVNESDDSMSDIRMENTPEVAVPKPEPQTPAENTSPELPDNTIEDIDLDLGESRVGDTTIEEPTSDETSKEEDTIGDTVTDSGSEDIAVDEEFGMEEDTEETPQVSSEIPSRPEEILPQEIIEPELSTDMTKKLLENLEVKLKEERKELENVEAIRPMTAPSYEAPGQGLVYNCQGGHWACIDGDEYKKCRQNYSWNKSESIPVECYPMAYLENEFDCATVQQEKVNSVPDLNFCGN